MPCRQLAKEVEKIELNGKNEESGNGVEKSNASEESEDAEASVGSAKCEDVFREANELVYAGRRLNGRGRSERDPTKSRRESREVSRNGCDEG